MIEEIYIHGSGSELQGVGRLADGRAVFVPGALPGERVRVRVTRNADRYAEAALEDVLEPAPARVDPPCPHYGRCGGCQSLHMTYEYALSLKRQRVFDALSRLGGVENPAVAETIGSASAFRTRNKAEYPIGPGPDGRPIAGAYEGGSHRVLPLTDCLLQKAESVACLNWLNDRLPRLKGAAQLRFLVTRVNRAGETMVTLSGETPNLQDGAAMARDLMRDVPAVVSVCYCQLRPRAGHALDGRCTLVAGQETLTDELLGLRFDLAPQAFFQVNPPQAEALYLKALEAACAEHAPERVLDIYCGAGTITLAAARRAGHATGVEIVRPAIENARENAIRNGLADKADFICGDATVEIPRLLKRGTRFEAIILDPPRKGADKPVLEAMLLARPARIAYVSCNPATLARDVKLLAAGGYALEWAQPVDMFPGTEHTECVVKLTRIGL